MKHGTRFACVLELPLDLEWIPAKSIGRLVRDAVLDFLAEKHANDEVPEHDPDIDPVAEAHFAFGFDNDSTTPSNVRRAILERRAAGQIVVREADGFGVVRDDDVMRGVLTRDDLAKLLASEWRIDLIAPPSPDSDTMQSGAATPAKPRELEPVSWEPQDVAGYLLQPAVGIESSAVPRVAQRPPALDRGRRVKPPQVFPAQEAEILKAIRELGHEPKLLPPRRAGKPWVKSAVWGKIGLCQLFASERVFNKAWDRLRKSTEIAERPGL